MDSTEVLIIGQGLAGSWLSWYLERAGISFIIIDDADPSGASRHAAGLINPVTGRRLVKTWLIDEMMPFALEAYQAMGSFLQTDLISETTIIDFFPTVQMMLAFEERCASDSIYLHKGEDATAFEFWFRYDMGWGSIRPSYLVQTEKLLISWRGHLLKKGKLRDERFDISRLVLQDSFIEYANIHASYIIFCDGIGSATNIFFGKLPFALNKGEGLLVEINDIPANTVFKKGMSIVPWEENIYWIGSSYQWEFPNVQLSETFRQFAENWLRNFLRVPFKIIDHFAAVRPATLERRPFVGFHPKWSKVGILNGLGTKGCSLAPYFAAQLTEKITRKEEIDPLADIRRFERILLK